MIAFLLTCYKALDVKALGPTFSAVLPAGGTIMGAYMVALISLFPMARTASAGILMGMGASVVMED